LPGNPPILLLTPINILTKLYLTNGQVNQYLGKSGKHRYGDVFAAVGLLSWGGKVFNQEDGMEDSQKPQQQVQIKADEKELLGQYSNLVMIHNTPEEFIVNFIYLFPTNPQGKLVASIIVSPAHAKRLHAALGENIDRYEAQFGPIREKAMPVPDVGFVQ
jgi:hypothetical protein